MVVLFVVRLVEVVASRVQLGPKEDTPLESLNTTSTKIYRIEEVPLDEMRVQDDEMLISCAHFHKEVFSTFGIPFLVKIKNGESFSNVKGKLILNHKRICIFFCRTNIFAFE